jgi:hypothetical protein
LPLPRRTSAKRPQGDATPSLARPGSARARGTQQERECSTSAKAGSPDGHFELQRRRHGLRCMNGLSPVSPPSSLVTARILEKHRAGAGSRARPAAARREPLRHPDALTHRSPFRSCTTSSAADALPSPSRQVSGPRRACTSVAIGRMPVGADTQIRRALSASDDRAKPCIMVRLDGATASGPATWCSRDKALLAAGQPASATLASVVRRPRWSCCAACA